MNKKHIIYGIFLVLLLYCGCINQGEKQEQKLTKELWLCPDFLINGVSTNETGRLEKPIEQYYFKETQYTKEHNITPAKWRDMGASYIGVYLTGKNACNKILTFMEK